MDTRMSIFGHRMSRAVLEDFQRSGRRLDLFLRIPGAMRVYRGLRVIEVNRKVVLLEAPDGSRKSIRRSHVLDPIKLRRAFESRVSVLDVADVVDTFL